ncbi:MAG: hypothetical protein HDT40_12035 [Lachnospiraceae bacterium]|nr:hypothetical protein [Lachnospiraceae bacterium]
MSDSEKLDLILTGVLDLNTRMYRVEEDLKEVREDVKFLKDRVNKIEEEVRHLKDRMGRVEAEVRLLKDRMDKVEDDLREVKEEVGILREDLKEVKEEVGILKGDLKEVKEEVTNTNLIIENEIRVNIQRIAEGHLDLSRNMHDVIRPNNEMEVLVVRVGVLETEVKYIKKNLHMNVAK